MRALVLTPRAFDDIRSASRWYDNQRGGLGLAFNAQRVIVVLVFHNSRDPASATARLHAH